MKRSTTTLIGAGALTAAIVGFGATVPSLAETLTTTAQGSDDQASTEETTAPQDGTDSDQGTSARGAEGDRHEGRGGHGGRRGGLDLSVASQTLGLSEDELITQLQDGTTTLDIRLVPQGGIGEAPKVSAVTIVSVD